MKKSSFLMGLLFLASFHFVGGAAAQGLSTQYRNAMSTAVYPDSSKIYSNLVQINQQNPNLIWKTFNGEKYLLTVTWKSASYYPNGGDSLYNTGPYQVWITTAPQLKNWFQQQGAVPDTNLRLKQLLGLPPVGADYKYFVEFWVKPSDLFRPCPDNDITDNACSTCFPANTPADYIAWVNQSRISRYYQCQLYDQYPWTQLGYTYDWNPANATHVGMSEFVIRENANVYVKQVSTTRQYLGNENQKVKMEKSGNSGKGKTKSTK